MKLSEGSLRAIMRGGTVEEPIMQILGNKKIQSTGANERYRLLVSDGVHLNSFAMLATQLNGRLSSGELSDYSVVKINRYITSLVNNNDKGNRRVMIILELTVLAPGSEVGVRIGNPAPLTDDNSADDTKPSATVAPQVSTRPVTSSPSNAVQKPRPMQQRQALNATSSPVDTMHTYPISSLNPYQNRWVIRARVTNKTAIRTYSNARGEGKLFSLELVDESGEIRATAFNEQVDKFYDMIEVNNVYFISRCSLKTANKKFSNLKNDYEMTFNSDTQIIPCHDDSSAIPALLFNFVPLEKLESMEANSIVDVIGVCKSAQDVQTLVARTTNRELKKREVLIVDSSNVAVDITMWGTQAENFDPSTHPVIAVKGGKISEYNGAKSVSLLMSSTMQLDPDIPEAHRLRGWFDSGGAQELTKNLSARTEGGSVKGQWYTLHEAKKHQIGSGEKPDYFTCKATVMMLRADNSIYKACPSEGCNKKVADMQNGMYRCEKCCQEFQNFKYRLLVSASIGDWTGKQWVTAFQENAEILLDSTAEKIGELVDYQDKFTEPFVAAQFKSYIFRLRAKMEMFNDESRLKTVIVSTKPLDFKEYNAYLIEKIEKAGAISSARQ